MKEPGDRGTGIAPSAAQREVYTEARAFREAQERLAPMINRHALDLADQDGDLADDLRQEAWVQLWELDSSRFDEHDHRYLKKALVSRMINALHRERRAARPELRAAVDIRAW